MCDNDCWDNNRGFLTSSEVKRFDNSSQLEKILSGFVEIRKNLDALADLNKSSIPVADETLAQHVNAEWSFSYTDVYRNISDEMGNIHVSSDDPNSAFVTINVYLKKVVKPDANNVARDLLIFETNQLFEKCQFTIKLVRATKKCDEQTLTSVTLELVELSKEFRKIKN